MKDEDCVRFLQWALPRLDLRWEGFRKPRGQVCKRIGRRMAALGLRSVDAYRARLEECPEEWETLDFLCRVTISRFYRDRGVFDRLREVELPRLARTRRSPGRPLRCWSAGCGSGEEPYTLTLIRELDLADRAPGTSLEVTATDVDPVVLERARRACYPRGTLDELPEGWVERAFTQVSGSPEPDGAGSPGEAGAADQESPEDGGESDEWCLRPRFRRGAVFLRQDVREAAPAGPFQAILCRNLVFTYHAEELQRRILDRILERLEPGGILAIGSHEELPAEEDRLFRVDPGVPVYRRREG